MSNKTAGEMTSPADLFEDRFIRPLLHPQYVVDFGSLERPPYPSAVALIDDLERQGIAASITPGGVRISPVMGAGEPNQVATMIGVCSSYGVRPRQGATRLEEMGYMKTAPRLDGETFPGEEVRA